MPRSLSSAWTAFYKFLLAPTLLAIFAVAFRSALEARGVYSGERSTPIPFELLAFGVLLLITVFASLRFCIPLKRVRLSEDGESLLISNFVREWTVPVALISDVSQNHWVRMRPVTVRFRFDPSCGSVVVFMPPIRVLFRFWRDDPETEELRALAAEHSLP